jgi:hypothetical protein
VENDLKFNYDIMERKYLKAQKMEYQKKIIKFKLLGVY